MPTAKSRAYHLTEIAGVLLMASGVVLYFWRLNSLGNAEKLSGAAPWLLFLAGALVGYVGAGLITYLETGNLRRAAGAELGQLIRAGVGGIVGVLIGRLLR